MDDVRPSERISVPQYRELLRQRHSAEGQVDEASAELLFNLNRAVNRLSLDFESLHRRQGLSWSGFRILNVIWVLEDAEVRDIARLSGASRATTWSALNTLERNGYVNRTRDTQDRRMVRVRLTESGLTTLKQAIGSQAAREAQWFSIFDAPEREILSRMLGQLADHKIPLPHRS